MRQKFTPYIYVLFFLINCNLTFTQQHHLEITAFKKEEKSFLNKIDFIKKHKDSSTIKSELIRVHSLIKNEGYFTSTLDSVVTIDKNFIAYFSLYEKTQKAVIYINQKDSLVIKINELENKLHQISSKLDNEGKLFSKINLKNIKIKNNTLYANLNIYESAKRKIDKIILKGYLEFPKSYLNHFFKIKRNNILSKKRLEKISEDSKNLLFVKEIKSPEILFTKDSTSLYLYLEKQTNNSIDAIVNFASQENGGVLFNGNIDLKLNNILNSGETFNLFWNSIGNERQEFNFATNIPYLFNLPFSPKLEFSIYKQDSTFTNTKFNGSLNYDINSKLKLALFYSTESSENLTQDNSEISSFSNNFFGFNLTYSKLNQDIFRNKKLYFKLNPTFGRRNGINSGSNQFKIEAMGSYLWQLNFRNSIFIKNKTGFLKSDQYFTNELFRIGGINSIRGFNEQSIFAKSYSILTAEYRLLTSTKSYLYSITDFGIISTKNNENVLALGLGYLFIQKNSKININFALGKTSNNSFNFNNLKIGLNWINFF